MQRVVWLLAMLSLLVGCGSTRVLTVSEVWGKAEAFEGKLIRVRGRAHFSTVPYVGLTGCIPAGNGRIDVVGRLDLFDENAPDPAYYSGKQPLPRIQVSDASLQCKGDTCQVTCMPFDPEEARVFELVGTLRVDTQGGKQELVLENVDLKESRRLAEEKLEPIPTGTFRYVFP